MFGYRSEEIVGRNIRTLIPEDRLAEEDAIIASIVKGERVPTFETIRRRKDGSEIMVAVTVSPVRDNSGNVIAASKIARDITRQHQMRLQLDASERRFKLMADNISQLAWIADGSGNIFWYNQRWFDYTGTNIAQMAGWGWRAVQHPDHIQRVVERISRSFETGEDWEDTFPLRGADGTYRWFLSRAKPARDETGRITNWFGTNTDVTEMRDAEQRIELLLQEVNHRSKNMLSIILSLARRTDGTHEDFVERLEQRIRGIAANQDLLVRRMWANVPMAEMIETQLRSLGDSRQQVSHSGPEVQLTPGVAEALAMAIHEMGTNALKYGALSVPEGTVEITWSLDPADDGDPEKRRFHVCWEEKGGPPARIPVHKGFGTRIIIDVPRVKLNANVETSYESAGFRWRLDCPLEAVS